MDESGEFENHPNLKYIQPTVTAILVPEEEKISLYEGIQTLWQAHKLTETHAKDAKNLTTKYFSELFSLIEGHGVLSFLLRHNEDIYQTLPPEYMEIHSANRYQGMATCLLEHIIFLYEPFFGKALDFSLLPNSRVTVFEPQQNKEIKAMKSMGYGWTSIGNQKTLFFVWNADILRSRIMLHAHEYIRWKKRLGERTFSKFETIVAHKSKDPFVHIADHLAYLSRSDQNFSERYSVTFDYNREYQTYRELIRSYLAGNFQYFLPEALQLLAKPTPSPFDINLQKMLDSAAPHIFPVDIGQLEELEQRIDRYLRNSRGNWQFILDLITHLLKSADSLPAKIHDTPRYNWLLFKLYSHRQSIHNHRGEDIDAWENYRKIQNLNLGKCTVSEYRKKIEVENRDAVTLANLFAFEQANEILHTIHSSLEQSLKIYQQMTDGILHDPLLGKIRGTMAQNMAFLCPRKPALFEKAETLFTEAAQEFTRESDTIRHDINLAHLYLDWEKQNKAQEIIEIIKGSDSVNAFLAAPAKNARYMQFVLAILLKNAVQNHSLKENEILLKTYSLKNLKKWFGAAVNEHPFELICGYLGRIATAANKEGAKDYFNHALRIPRKGRRTDQPTLQAIRAQIWVWWAIEEHRAGRPKSAMEKIGRAINIMKAIGEIKELATILYIDKNGTATGWFADGWQALQKIDEQKRFDRKACDTFLKCFTFNYR